MIKKIIISKSIHLFLLIVLFSGLSYVISKQTYNKIESRIQSKIIVTEDRFVTVSNGRRLFNFNLELNKSVYKVATIEGNDRCPLEIVGARRPILRLYDSDLGQYKIEVVSNDVLSAQMCIDNILEDIEDNFKNQITKLIKIEEEDSNLRGSFEIKDFESRMEKELEKYNRRDKTLENKKKKSEQIHFSLFLNLLNSENSGKISEIAITSEYLFIKYDDDADYYTRFMNVAQNDLIMQKLINSDVPFYILQTKSDEIDPIFREIRIRSNLDLKIKKAIYKKLIDRKPYIVLSSSERDTKILYSNYQLLIFFFMNTIAVIIFSFFNRNYYKNVTSFIRKSSINLNK